MGMSRLTVVVVGNHGCQREKKGGDDLSPGCGLPGCVDCLSREFVAKLKAAGGNSISEATLHHWPGSSAKQDGTAGDVVDNLLSERRMGSF